MEAVEYNFLLDKYASSNCNIFMHKNTTAGIKFKMEKKTP
jgi:hypothetical protein